MRHTEIGRFARRRPQALTARFAPFLIAAVVGGADPTHPAAVCPAADFDEEAGGGDAKPGNQWALLIGVEKYHRASPLRFTANDVDQLAATLKDYGGFSPVRILRMTDHATNARWQPLRASILSELPAWLRKPAANDQVLVYFSGHGFRDADGKLYLAPLDCDPDNPAATGIPIEWFHQTIAQCPAKFKLLVLDACHAGSEKGPADPSGVSAGELGRSFEDLSDVLTLASSSADQQSQIWDDKKQSLFSYWLNDGLKGHADGDGDGAVDVDELFKYVHAGVVRTADARFPMSQEPVRIVHPDRVGVPVVARLKPQPLKIVLADMAEQLADALADRQFTRVGVLEFTNDSPLGELLGASFGGLGRYCGDELERQLTELAARRFSVVDRRHLQAALKTRNFSTADLGSSPALGRLSGQAGGMPAIVVGTLNGRARSVVRLQCKLIHTETGDAVVSLAGVARIDESQWAMLGGSAAVTQAVYRIDVPENGPSGMMSVSDQVVEKLDRLAKGPHPLLDPNFPFRVKIMIAGKERQGFFRGNDFFVPVRVGEVYEVRLVNRSGRMVLMRLLVDGLNTLPEKATTAKGVLSYQVAARVNLDAARHWVLDPGRSVVNAVRGFVTETSNRGKLREFKVVDAVASLAARRKFTEGIGLITAAFYAPAGAERGGVGTGFGDVREEDLSERGGTRVGNLLGVVNIRYVEAGALPARR
ncbi:MAG TPA: caspase family protein [Pirellulales bacterium]|nr:caspase family protein [Pirellulales bacterium]